MSGSAGGEVKVWDFSNFDFLHSLTRDSSEGISSISIGTNGRLIVANGQRLANTLVFKNLALANKGL